MPDEPVMAFLLTIALGSAAKAETFLEMNADRSFGTSRSKIIGKKQKKKERG